MVSRDGVRVSVVRCIRSFSELYSAPSKAPTPSTDEQNVRDSGEMWRKHLHNLIKLVINVHIWTQIYSLGHKYTHSGVNISEMCSLEA